MPKLPKSVVIEGRRYPTWALSSQARAQLMNLHLVDAHIAELRQRLGFYTAAYKHSQVNLRAALSDMAGSGHALDDKVLGDKVATAKAQRYFWHSVPLAWGEENFPTQAATLNVQAFGASGYYQAGDRVLLYVKSRGVVGWGIVEGEPSSTLQQLVWCFEAASLDCALPASALKTFSLRHPNRVSQRLPGNADIERLLAALLEQGGKSMQKEISR